MHELEIHAPEVYTEISQYLREQAGDDVAKLEKKVERLYKRRGIELTEKTRNSEVDARLAEKVFSDSSFLDRIIADADPAHAAAKRTLLTKLKEVFDKLVSAFKGERVPKELREMRDKLTEAFKSINAPTSTQTAEAMYSIKEIVGDSGHNYGKGVYLDSTLLDGLTDSERKQMVILRVQELGGQTFTAFDSNGNAVDIKIADYKQKFTNHSGQKKRVITDLSTKYNKDKTKQEAVVLADELIAAANAEGTSPAKYSHGWLDNNGNNVWEKWSTYLQDKNNTVWKATLHIATATDGTKYLYDIDPIKEVERGGTSPQSPQQQSSVATKISQQSPVVNTQNSDKSGMASLKESDAAYLSLAEKYRDGTATEEEKTELEKAVEDAAKTAEYTVRAYHGTGRADRVGTVFRADRATSGPMAYFTDSREIAERYAKDKQDTSIAYDEEYDSYYTQFRINRGGKSIAVGELWNRLSYQQKQQVKEAGKHLTWDDDMENVIWKNDATHGLGNWDAYELNRHRGNAIETLIDCWLESGELYGREEDFLRVLELAGINGAEYRNPTARNEKVYDVYLKLSNPFDTANATVTFAEAFEAWYAKQDSSKYQRESSNADMWDKNNITLDEWLERLRDDAESGTTRAWTTVPDAVTDYLKRLGYDGIKDKGGKFSGDEHTVWIPFYSEQVKSADPVTYDDNGDIIPLSERFNSEKTDIRYSLKEHAPIAEGSSGEAYYGNKKGQSVKFHYALADVSGVIASHDIYGDENAEFPAELQPRDRSRRNSQSQMREIANNLAPSRLGASSDVQNGAPIVGPDMVVESGNGRVGALQYLAERGRLGDYTAWLKEHAEEFKLKMLSVQKLPKSCRTI